MAQQETEKSNDKSGLISGMQISPGNRGDSIVIRKRIMILIVVLLAGAIIAAGYFYNQLSDIKKNPNKTAKDELNATVATVGKLILLPANEQPTVATVTDPDRLRDQPFFANAKKGDKVLIYTNAKKAILYDPTEDKIVEVAPIAIGQTPPANIESSSTAQTSSTTGKKH